MKTISELRSKKLDEMVTGHLVDDPPQVLVLRRTSVRIFPHGEKVALYRNENMNLDVSIPYHPKSSYKPVAGIKIGEGKEETLEESAIHKIHHIARSMKDSAVIFKNGVKASVSAKAAAKLLKLHGILTPQNKKAAEDLINKGPDGLKRVSDFADEHFAK